LTSAQCMIYLISLQEFVQINFRGVFQDSGKWCFEQLVHKIVSTIDYAMSRLFAAMFFMLCVIYFRAELYFARNDVLPMSRYSLNYQKQYIPAPKMTFPTTTASKTIPAQPISIHSIFMTC